MAEKAGFSIRADLAALRKELADARTEFRDLNEKAIRAATGVQTFEKNARSAGSATRSLDFLLGHLGASSIEQVVSKMVSLGRQSVMMAMNLQGIENRAKAIFGDSFPKMLNVFDEMGQKMRRSTSDLLSFGTGFATLMDAVGVSGDALQKYSVELTELTIKLGKAHPEMSDAQVYDAIESGIRGNTRALASLGVLMKQGTLERFAQSEGIKLNIKDMDEEQLMMLRTQFLLKETIKQQQAGEAATGQLGDSIKSTAASWHDLLEQFGQDITPFISAANSAMSQMLGQWMDWIGSVGMAFRNVWLDISQATKGGTRNQDGFEVANFAKPGFKNANEAAMALNKTTVTQAPKSGLGGGLPSNFWSKRAQDEAGGAKKAAEDIKKVEEDILKTMGDQAKSNRERLEQRRDELKLLERTRGLTTAEARELEAINRRVEFQKNRVEDVTRAWEEQLDKLEEVNEKIADINQRIIDEDKKLQETLKGIDKDAAREKADTLAEFVKELQQVEKDLRDVNVSGSKQFELEARRRELEKLIDPFRQTEEGLGMLRSAEEEAGLDPFQRIQREAQRKKQEAAQESNVRLEGLQNELMQAQTNKDQIVRMEEEKKRAVLEALAERSEKTAAIYEKIQIDTTAHVNAQIAEFSRLAASARVPATAAVRRAAGGPVYGPGGATDDRIPALLSNGEYVINAAATRMYRPLIEKINAMGVRRFADGGQVNNYDDHRNVRVDQHFHHSAMSSPLVHRWSLLQALR